MNREQNEAALKAHMMADFARLAEQAGRYSNRMPKRVRTEYLELSLCVALMNIEEFDPKKEDFLVWWDDVLRASVSAFDWPERGYNGWEHVTGLEVLERVHALGGKKK